MAEAFSGSGVLAVLVCALYVTDAGTDFGDRDYRLVGDAFWEITEMLSSGFAFGLIGLELGVVPDDTGDGWPRLLGVASAVVAVVVVIWLLTTLHWWLWRDADLVDRVTRRLDLGRR